MYCILYTGILEPCRSLLPPWLTVMHQRDRTKYRNNTKICKNGTGCSSLKMWQYVADVAVSQPGRERRRRRSLNAINWNAERATAPAHRQAHYVTMWGWVVTFSRVYGLGHASMFFVANGSYYPPPLGERGIVFAQFVSFFLCFFVSNITRKRLDRFA